MKLTDEENSGRERHRRGRFAPGQAGLQSVLLLSGG